MRPVREWLCGARRDESDQARRRTRRPPRCVPELFLRDVPQALDIARPPASPEELAAATELRRRYLFDGDSLPYLEDIARAFRLARGVQAYVEVGTYDRGNLAYVSSLADERATLVGVDLRDDAERSRRLAAELLPDQRVVEVSGSSQDPEAVAAVRDALGSRKADLVFIDGHHAADSVMADAANFIPLVRPGGLVFFHDVYWAGRPDRPGVSWALQNLDRRTPIHVVFARDPIHRFLPWMNDEEVWGGVGILQVDG